MPDCRREEGRVLLQGAGSVAVVPGCGPVLLPNIPKTWGNTHTLETPGAELLSMASFHFHDPK